MKKIVSVLMIVLLNISILSAKEYKCKMAEVLSKVPIDININGLEVKNFYELYKKKNTIKNIVYFYLSDFNDYYTKVCGNNYNCIKNIRENEAFMLMKVVTFKQKFYNLDYLLGNAVNSSLSLLGRSAKNAWAISKASINIATLGKSDEIFSNLELGYSNLVNLIQAQQDNNKLNNTGLNNTETYLYNPDFHPKKRKVSGIMGY